MTETTMRSRVAYALYEADRANSSIRWVDWSGAKWAKRKRYLERADFVLSAMREPTEQMKTAGVRYAIYPGDTWRAMIDATFSEQIQ